MKNTIRKAAEHLILQEQARKLAEEKRQVRFQFISVLAHELKAPLGAIEGYLHIIRDRTAGDDQAAYDKMLDRSMVRLDGMRKLITDLLDLTRIESGQKQRELAETDITSVARDAIATFAPDAAKRNITLDLHADDKLTMSADRGEIEIIFNNLISNAIKYNRDDGKVDITLNADDKTVTLTVADTGIGMSADDLKRIFDDFVRIKNAKTRNTLGSGLGLSIVKKLALLYRGTVTAKSEIDRGTTFTVTLSRNTS